MALGAFPIPRRLRTTPTAPATRPADRVNSYMFHDSELRRATSEAVCVVTGCAALSREQPGDLARSFFGRVIR